MNSVISATEARVHFGALMKQLEDGGTPVIVQRDGVPKVVVLSLEQYENLLPERNGGEDWKALVRLARERVKADLAGKTLPSPVEVINQMREERDADIPALRGRKHSGKTRRRT